MIFFFQFQQKYCINSFYNIEEQILMKSATILVILALVFLATCTNFHLSPSSRKVYREEDWDEIEIPCEGGSGDYQYDFRDLPYGWKIRGSRIYVPTYNIRQSRYFGCRVSVYDRQQRIYIKKSLIFSYRSGVLDDIYEAEYEFDYQSEEKIVTYIRGYQAQVTNKVSYNYNSNYVLPSWGDVEILISQGETTRIRTVINECISSSLVCEVKAQFLSELLGKIQAYIAIERTQTEKFRQTIFVLKQELRELYEELERLQSSTIDISFLKAQLEKTEIQLRTVTQQIEEKQYVIYDYEQQTERIRSQIFTLKTVEIEEIQFSIEDYQTQIEEIDVQVSQLEIRIQQLRERRVKVEQLQREATIKIKQIRIQIKQLNIEVRQIEEKVRQVRITIQKNREIRETLEYKIQRIRIQIQESSYTDRDRIYEIKEIISKKEKEIQDLSEKVQSGLVIIEYLQSSLEKFTRIIDRHYYKCYRIVQEDDDFEDNGYVPVIPSNSFLNYLKRTYGQVEQRVIRARFSGKVSVKRVNIFKPAWIRVFGIPFSSGYGNNLDYLKEEFQCSKAEKLESFKGVIVQITSNIIKVETKDRQQYSVHLGGCTQIQVANEKELPQVGDRIYWKGYNKNKQYYAHEFACF